MFVIIFIILIILLVVLFKKIRGSDKSPVQQLPIQNPPNKKKSGCLGFVGVVCIGILAALIIPSCNSSVKKKSDSKEEKSSASDTSKTHSDVQDLSSMESSLIEKVFVTLTAGKSNEYSEQITLNAGTEFEEIRTVYFLPAGDYIAKNVTDKPTQINVYSRATHMVDGWEEPLEVAYVSQIASDESVSFTVADDQYIYISEPTVIDIYSNP